MKMSKRVLFVVAVFFYIAGLNKGLATMSNNSAENSSDTILITAIKMWHADRLQTVKTVDELRNQMDQFYRLEKTWNFCQIEFRRRWLPLNCYDYSHIRVQHSEWQLPPLPYTSLQMLQLCRRANEWQGHREMEQDGLPPLCQQRLTYIMEKREYIGSGPTH